MEGQGDVLSKEMPSSALHSKNIILVDMSKMNQKGARAKERSKKATISVQARDNGHFKVKTRKEEENG